MTMYIYDANGNGVLNLVGATAGAMEEVNRVRRTIVPDRIADLVSRFSSTDLDNLAALKALDGLQEDAADWVERGSLISDALRTMLEALLPAWAADQEGQADDEVTTAIAYLVQAMKDNLVYVTPCGVTATVEAAAGNIGDVALAISPRRGDGQVCQHALTETLVATLDGESSTSPSIAIVGPAATDDRLDLDWPAGSDTDTSVTGTTAAEGLLPAGGFGTWVDGLPSDWVLAVGTPGATVRRSGVASHLIKIDGTPTEGNYYLVYTDAYGARRATASLTWNASGETVEAALQALPTLSTVAVETAGDEPNYEHMITFEGVPGTVQCLEVISYLDRGTITVSEIQPGDLGAFSGASLRIDGDGAELTEIYAPLSGLTHDTVYFLNAWLAKTVTVLESTSTSQSGTSSSSTNSSSSTFWNESTSTSSSLSSSSSQYQIPPRARSADAAPDVDTSQAAFLERFRLAEAEAYGLGQERADRAEETYTSWSSHHVTSSNSSASTSSSLSTTSQSSSESSPTSASSPSSPSSPSSNSSSSESQSSSSSTYQEESSSSSSSQFDEGDLRIEIVDGIGGEVICDSAGHANAMRVNLEGVGSTPQAFHFSFRIPGSVQQPVYVRLRLANPMPADYSLFVDEVAVIAGMELYTGGPWAAAFTGRMDGIDGDTWRIRVQNDRRGRLQEWFQRFFAMSDEGVMLPTVGQTLVPDSICNGG